MATTVSAQDVYTDVKGLNAIKSLGRSDRAEGLKEVARQFEGLFIHMMLKSMRDSGKVFSEGSIFQSNELDIHQQNFDSQLSLHLSQGKGLGLADVLYRQMLNQYRVKEQANESADEKSSAAGKAARGPADFDSPQDFVRRLLPAAKQAASELGTDSGTLIAQAALETGWGKNMPASGDGKSRVNLFGIKNDSSWHGPASRAMTVEVRDGVVKKEYASFRAYDSVEESFADFVRFLKNNPRYKTALSEARSGDQFIEGIARAGYATDPEYAEKVKAVKSSPLMRSALAAANLAEREWL